jgi:hydrophobe/amphiphile efflux-1 (HAE1) family protein
MRLSSVCVMRPVGIVLLTAGLLLLGLFTYNRLGIASLPAVDLPTMHVNAYLPGGSPETMAAVVATPIERRLGVIDGVTQLTSYSSIGNVNIAIQFNLNRNIESAARDVQAAIDASLTDLPADLPRPPTYWKSNPAGVPPVVLALTSEVIPSGELYDLVDTILVPKLSQIEGVAEVSINGAEKSAVRVELDPRAVAAYGLTTEEIRRALLRANGTGPKGSLEGDDQAFTISADDQVVHADDYEQVIVAWRNNAPIRIRDVGHAIDSTRDVRVAARFNQQPGVIIYVHRMPDANIVALSDRVLVALDEIKGWLPPSVNVSVLAERTGTIRAAISDVKFTLTLAIGLVVMTMLLFLRRFWATAIPSISIPASLAGTCAVMYLLGYTLDNISLLALTVAIGFVVDDAIVMIENIARHMEKGETPVRAALKGAKQIQFTVISITISLIAAFIPFLFMGGYLGRFLREFSVTLTVAILVSGLVALTLTPALTGQLLRPRLKPENRLQRLCERLLAGCLAGYEWTLRRALRFRVLMVLLTIAAAVGTIYLYRIQPKGFFPRQDINIVRGFTSAPSDISFDVMNGLQKRVEDIIRDDPAVESFGSFLGGVIPNGGLFINLKAREAHNATVEAIIARLKAKLTGIPNLLVFLNPVQDINIGARQSNSPYQFTLQADRIEDLYRWSERTINKFRTLKELRDIIGDQRLRGLTAYIAFDRDSLGRLGVTPADIDQALYNAFGQRMIDLIYTGIDQYNVILTADPSFALDPARLQDLYIQTSTGESVPLKALARIEHKFAPLSITHQGTFPSATVSFNVAAGYSPSEALEEIDRAVAELKYPESVRGSFQGEARTLRDHLETQPLLILTAIIAVYIVLGVLYESYIHPLTILSTLPSAGFGAFLTLYLTGTQLTVIAMVGLILLVGIVKKNAIMMIDFALEAERAGMRREEAIVQACLLRFRPIMMTTLAAVLGALPIALDHGLGSELRRPLGITLLGGLLVSQVLTMFSTPVIYLYMGRIADFFARRRQRALALSHSH